MNTLCLVLMSDLLLFQGIDVASPRRWTHKLANLVILTHRKNASASNWDFAVKKEKYFTGKGGVSPFPLTTSVLKTKSWTEDILADRQAALIGKLATGWCLND